MQGAGCAGSLTHLETTDAGSSCDDTDVQCQRSDSWTPPPTALLAARLYIWREDEESNSSAARGRMFRESGTEGGDTMDSDGTGRGQCAGEGG